MLKKNFLFTILLFSTIVYGQSPLLNSSQSNDLISNFKHLSSQQLFDTANYYYGKNSTDTALVCYSLFINAPVKDADFEQQKRIIEAYNKTASIYYLMCDYRSAYEFLIKTLLLCEKYNNTFYEPQIYNNIGYIYHRFNQYDMAKLYYLKALDLSKDSATIVILLNNLGDIELRAGRMDSALYYLNKSLQMSKQINNINSHVILNTVASFYQKNKQYDSAYYYYQLSLDETRKINRVDKEAEYLSTLSKLFFETNKIDSTLFYIDLSSNIATKNNNLRILAENYLTLSKIEELKGRDKNALEYYKKYVTLKDSVFNTEKFGDINQLQRLYEVSKTNQQIEQLVIEQQIKERTIHYQKIIQLITLVALLSVSIVLLYIFLQKRKLNTAYKALFEKNLEIINLQENSPKKYKKSTLTDNMQEELLDKILILMEDTSIVCDSKFTIDKLAGLVNSNHTYVSQVINTALKKNFRSFLNSFRIREAQRLFSEPEATKYTIESIALRVGFRSQSAFYDAFKEITGVSPNFYLKSMRKHGETV